MLQCVPPALAGSVATSELESQRAARVERVRTFHKFKAVTSKTALTQYPQEAELHGRGTRGSHRYRLFTSAGPDDA